MGWRRIYAALILYKTLGYPELGYNNKTYRTDNVQLPHPYN